MYVNECAVNVHAYYTAGATESGKDVASNNINLQLFTIWSLYFGPWRFDISKDTLVNRYITNVRAKYRDIAKKGSM